MPNSSASTRLPGLSFMPMRVFTTFSHRFFSQCIVSRVCRSNKSCKDNVHSQYFYPTCHSVCPSAVRTRTTSSAVYMKVSVLQLGCPQLKQNTRTTTMHKFSSPYCSTVDSQKIVIPIRRQKHILYAPGSIYNYV